MWILIHPFYLTASSEMLTSTPLQHRIFSHDPEDIILNQNPGCLCLTSPLLSRHGVSSIKHAQSAAACLLVPQIRQLQDYGSSNAAKMKNHGLREASPAENHTGGRSVAEDKNPNRLAVCFIGPASSACESGGDQQDEVSDDQRALIPLVPSASDPCDRDCRAREASIALSSV